MKLALNVTYQQHHPRSLSFPLVTWLMYENAAAPSKYYHVINKMPFDLMTVRALMWTSLSSIGQSSPLRYREVQTTVTWFMLISNVLIPKIISLLTDKTINICYTMYQLNRTISLDVYDLTFCCKLDANVTCVTKFITLSISLFTEESTGFHGVFM